MKTTEMLSIRERSLFMTSISEVVRGISEQDVEQSK
jgi:hypothetical protein